MNPHSRPLNTRRMLGRVTVQMTGTLNSQISTICFP